MSEEEELEEAIKNCPGDSVITEDPNGDIGYTDWYLTQEPWFDWRTVVYNPQNK